MSGRHTESEFEVGDLIKPHINYVLITGRTLGEYLKDKYGVDPDLPFEVIKRYGIISELKQGIKHIGVWELRSGLWYKISDIIDLDEDDEDCI